MQRVAEGRSQWDDQVKHVDERTHDYGLMQVTFAAQSLIHARDLFLTHTQTLLHTQVVHVLTHSSYDAH